MQQKLSASVCSRDFRAAETHTPATEGERALRAPETSRDCRRPLTECLRVLQHRISALRLSAHTQMPRCGANVAHIKQPRPDYGLGFQVKGREKISVPTSLGSGVKLHPTPVFVVPPTYYPGAHLHSARIHQKQVRNERPVQHSRHTSGRWSASRQNLLASRQNLLGGAVSGWCRVEP